MKQVIQRKINVAVVTGGEASEVAISLKSAGVVCRHLNPEKFNVYQVVIERQDWIAETPQGKKLPVDKNDFTVSADSEKISFDVVFIALHGTPAEDGKLQGYFDLLKIPYNACGVLQAALTFDKRRCKEYLSVFGIQSARGMLLKKNEPRPDITHITSSLSLPLFIKPNQNGSSFGASKAERAEELMPAIEEAFKYDTEILVEEFISGTEVTCGVMTRNGETMALPLTEIRSKTAFFDYKAKYEGASQEITPAEIEPALAQKIQQTSVDIYRLLGFKGMARIDYIIRRGAYYMLEVNSIPGLSEESIIPQQAKAVGISLSELFEISLMEALRRE